MDMLTSHNVGVYFGDAETFRTAQLGTFRTTSVLSSVRVSCLREADSFTSRDEGVYLHPSRFIPAVLKAPWIFLSPSIRRRAAGI